VAVLVLVLVLGSTIGARGAMAGPSAGGRIVGKVAVTEADGKPSAKIDAVVYVVGPPAPASVSDAIAATLAQKSRKFVPELIAITAGETVDFPNTDPYLHNVFSESPARKFDLGSFKKGDTKTQKFPTPGVVDVYCNIHPDMAATILVLPNRFHVHTGADGSYTIEGVPPGNWTVFAYTRGAAKPESAKITVTDGADAKSDFAIMRGAPAEHTNKFGERYQGSHVYQ
jgi:plastocyanin